MTAPLPSFSVVIASYNYGPLVGAAIASALAQDYPSDRLEVIVVDDGSTDDSRTVYPQFSADPRVLAILQENRGQSAAFCAGVRAAKGDYVCLLDADDVYLPHKLARVAAHIATLGEAPDTLFLCHDLIIENAQSGVTVRETPTWFDLTSITRLPDCLTLDQPVTHFPFSIPCGLVFSRRLLSDCLEALPSWEFNRGTDGIVCPAAFLATGRVHYLREQLGIYRIHGGNSFASIVDGRYIPRFNPLTRGPKTQRFLEHWLDMLPLEGAERALRLQYLRNREHFARRPSASRGLTDPAVQIAVIGGPDPAAAQESAQRSLQSHGNVRIDLFPGPGAAAGHAASAPSELAVLAQAWQSSDAEYIVFLRAGDRLDREFVERHLTLRHNGALVALSCSDIRLMSRQGSLVHADVMRNSGAWKHTFQPIPPMVTGLRDWVAAPWSACMLRRGALLDRLFERAGSVPVPLQTAGFWLACQLAHHTAGLLRIRETLSSCALDDGAAASYGYLSAATGADGALVTPPVEDAAQWLQEFCRQEQALLRRWLPPAWHQRFASWLPAQRGH